MKELFAARMNRTPTNFDSNLCGLCRSFFAWSQITPPHCETRSRTARAAVHVMDGTKSPGKVQRSPGKGAAAVEAQVRKAIEAGRLAVVFNEAFRAISLRDVPPAETDPAPDPSATSELPRPG